MVNGTTYYRELERISREGNRTLIGPMPVTLRMGLSQQTPKQQELEGRKARIIPF